LSKKGGYFIMIRLKRDNDEQIIASVLAGRHDRFSLLVERYLPVVRSIAYARLRSGADVDDVAQEAFLEAYQQLDRLRERRKFGPWIAAIARNVSGRLLTQRVRDREYSATLRAQEITLPSDMAFAEVSLAIRAQVESLDSELREVLMLHYFARKNSREIARIMELSDAAVRKRLQRAREVVGDRLLRRFEAEDLRAVYSPKDAARRIVASALTAGNAWESASACAPVGVAASASVLAAGGASKSLVGLLAVLAACSGVLIWVNVEPAPPPAPEEPREWASAPEFEHAEPAIRAEPPAGDPTGVPVSGRVLGTDGTPIPDAMVNGYYRRLDQQVVQFEAHSDDTGAYHFYLDVPWGVVSVEAAKEGFVSAERVRGNVANVGVSGLDCTLLREAVAEGVVVDERGNRLADMPVAAHLYAGERHYPEVGAVTAGQGGFRLVGLLPGEHGLAVMEKQEFHESLEAARITLAEGEIKTGLRLVYDGQGLVVAGRVRDNNGEPVAGAR
jgi:RNA polymerase sigma factor (sigma-70 family)